MDETTFRDLLARHWTTLFDPHTIEKGADYLRRGYVRRAPGRLTNMSWDPVQRVLRASGSGARPGSGPIELWFPEKHLWFIKGQNLGKALALRGHRRGALVAVRTKAPHWSLVMRFG